MDDVTKQRTPDSEAGDAIDARRRIAPFIRPLLADRSVQAVAMALAKEAVELLRVDGSSPEEIERVLDWARTSTVS